MSMLKLPFFNELGKADTVLLAGAGGGFDIFCGPPLYFALEAAGKKVYLANLSFSFLPPPQMTKEARLSPALLRVTADTPYLTDYFPEMFLAQWFREQGKEINIFLFRADRGKAVAGKLRGIGEAIEHRYGCSDRWRRG